MKLQSYTLQYLSIALLAVIGIWAVIFYLNMLDEIYDSIDDGLDNSRLLIMDKIRTDSTLIYKNEFKESNYAIRELPAANATLQRDVYFDSSLYMQNEKDYEPVRMLKTVFLAPSGNYYELQVVSSMVEEDDLITDLLYSLVWLYAILLASVLLINNIMLRTIWKPFFAILEKLKTFRLGSHEDFSVSPTKVDEFNELNSTVTALLHRTLQTFNSQKQFIENASHELQTPLAISVNKLELFAERNSLSDTQIAELTTVIQSLERLTRINKTLLLLSRIENRQFPEQELIHFKNLSEHVITLLLDLAEFRRVDISMDVKGSCMFLMNRELATIMLSNLIKNAITHNHPEGKVVVHLSANAITISNSGVNEPLDQHQVFNRFYKQSAWSGSTGLGLAIVKSIADYYGISLKYSFETLHSFTLRFPAPPSGH